MIIEQGNIDDILQLQAQIPEFERKTSKESMVERFATSAHLILIARINGLAVGYNIGYEKSSTEFYSWLAGVIPSFRKQGVATALRKYQEKWAFDSGYQGISVKSMNRFPAMLHLLIASQYQILSVEQTSELAKGKILFYKRLKKVDFS